MLFRSISHPHSRATPPGAPVAAGYMTIVNAGSEPDRLIGGSADFAATMEIHEMTMEGDVMKMRVVEGGIAIPAGGEVVLEQGGTHVMFRQLHEPLKEGESRAVRLVFERLGEVEIEFVVEAMGHRHGQEPQTGHGDGHGSHGGHSN